MLLIDLIVDRIQSTRQREGRPSIRFGDYNDTHHRAVMWETLYSDIQMPKSLRGCYQLTQDILEYTGMALDEMNDTLNPPPAAFPIYMDSTTSSARPSRILASTNVSQIRKARQYSHRNCY